MLSFKLRDLNIENIETVLFDKDGTIIDLHYFWGKMTELRCEAIIEKYNLDYSLFSNMCMRLGYDVKSKKMLSDGITALYSRSKIIEIFKSDLQDFGVNITNEHLENIFDEVSLKFYKNMMEYTKPIESALSFIKILREKGIKIGIVTSDSVVSTELTIKNFNWDNLFDVVVGRESSSQTKESGALTSIALYKLNANPKTTLMIGDAPMDYISAKNAGVENTILVATGQIDFNDLSNITPFVVNTLNDVKII